MPTPHIILQRNLGKLEVYRHVNTPGSISPESLHAQPRKGLRAPDASKLELWQKNAQRHANALETAAPGRWHALPAKG